MNTYNLTMQVICCIILFFGIAPISMVVFVMKFLLELGITVMIDWRFIDIIFISQAVMNDSCYKWNADRRKKICALFDFLTRSMISSDIFESTWCGEDPRYILIRQVETQNNTMNKSIIFKEGTDPSFLVVLICANNNRYLATAAWSDGLWLCIKDSDDWHTSGV